MSDSRTETKDCVVCEKSTFMGKKFNTPLHSRERWDGKQYLRYCGPECEESFFKVS